MDQYALITGASKGIGKSIAIALAKRKFNLLLIARSAAELEELKVSLMATCNVKVAILVLDLSAQGAAEKVHDWCQQNSYAIFALINNAGFGLWGDFEQIPINEQLNMLQLNVMALTELTHHMIPSLKKQHQSYILNIASTAAYQAVPTLAVYAATKSYVLSFSRAIRVELKKSTVSVTCICPGPADTGFADRAGLSAISDLADKFNMNADVVAEIGVKAMLAKKAEVIPGFTNLVSAQANRFLPKSLVEWVVSNIYKTKE